MLSKISKKNKIIVVVLVVIVMLAILLIVNKVWVYFMFCTLLLLLMVNVIVYEKTSYNAKHLFSTIGRNYKIMIIGENCDVSQLTENISDSILFLSPSHLSMFAAGLLVKRLFSLLDEENGQLFLILHQESIRSNKISVFEIPYLHTITLNALHLQHMKWKSRFPLFSCPIDSLEYLISHPRRRVLVEAKCPSDDILSFCHERNIQIRFFYLKP